MKDPTWLAVSTHDGEYEELWIAHEWLKKTYPNAKLLICPRHLSGMFKVKKFFKEDSSVSFNETLGNMESYFDMADVVFVGGTFTKIGGHNVLEPVSRRIVSIVGPYTDKIEDLLEACVSVIRVKDGRGLADALVRLFSNEQERTRIAEECYVSYMKAREGVLESYLSLIVPIIDRHL